MAEGIFSQHRALGYVSDHVPLITRYIERRQENLIVTCVGRAFHTYGCSHFTLINVSGPHPGDITSLAGDKYHVYTASECKIFAWRRSSELKHTYVGHTSPVHSLLPFGPHLISIDEDSNLKVWNIKTEEIVLELTFVNSIFTITTILHPSTYMNKVLLGSEQGALQLWNLKTSKMIYTFRGWDSSVLCMAQAPAIDVVAIGLANGKIKLHNLKVDQTVFELVQDWGSVTSITFRTDGQPIMATGSMQGHIVLWNLEQRKVESQILNAHFGSVTGLKCLPSEPLIVSSSPDNSLKLWIFDLADGGARLLRVREGHADPPTCLRFYGDDGRNILTSGGDSSLRIYSTVTESFNKSLGRASYNRQKSKKKGKIADDNLIMPAITEFVSEQTREKEWDNIAAIHLGLGVVTTWSYDKLRMGEHKLLPESFATKHCVNATSLCLTQCGNFVVIGYNTGDIHRYNIQSGIHRAEYGGNTRPHEGPVRGVLVDPLNQLVISAGRDSKVKFWAFKPTTDLTGPKTIITLSDAVLWLRSHKESSLIAMALEDFTVILIDMDTRRLVRQFSGHSAQLTDATFSPDARWLVTASMDCTIRTWDIPAAQPIDVFRVPEACISLSFSPVGDFLATAHVCNLGVYLWCNRTLFSHVSLKSRRENEAIPMMSLPGSSSEQDRPQEDENIEIDAEEDEEEHPLESPDQIAPELITMSTLATSKWLNLLNIDIVKKRNKPIVPPKTPKAAPFFLPTIPGLDIAFDVTETQQAEEKTKFLVPENFSNLTPFGQMLRATIDSDDFTEIVKFMKELGPSAIDREIQSLTLDSASAVEIMLQYMKLTRFMMRSNENFELSQAYLAAFLRVHGPRITEELKLVKYASRIQKTQFKSWNTLREKFFYNLSVVQHFKKI